MTSARGRTGRRLGEGSRPVPVPAAADRCRQIAGLDGTGRGGRAAGRRAVTGATPAFGNCRRETRKYVTRVGRSVVRRFQMTAFPPDNARLPPTSPTTNVIASVHGPIVTRLRGFLSKIHIESW